MSRSTGCENYGVVEKASISTLKITTIIIIIIIIIIIKDIGYLNLLLSKLRKKLFYDAKTIFVSSL